jgi:hypothetical protein
MRKKAATKRPTASVIKRLIIPPAIFIFISANVEARHEERRQPLGIAYADLLGS